MNTTWKLLSLGVLLLGCNSAGTTQDPHYYSSETLLIQPVSEHAYQHISYLNTESFGKVACNGMIVVDDGEALIFDTPADEPASEELLRWVETKLHAKVKAIVPTHFHADCLAGLEVFHRRQIPSYASHATIQLATANGSAVPQNGFDRTLELEVGDEKVVTEFFGEGHTKDNVVAYVPDDEVVFGGCLIKEVDASKGNLEDANVAAWPQTVTALKSAHPDLNVVIPGHGASGGIELLDYTVQLFTPEATN
ncbi:metallo-beta-lactamase class B [Catalinimonas alkaloidigena]|uniref:beta-lactamase n=1 Tax=Catalinimonas alkaloidigena TaxID=1075417 RepID=A0A1G8X0U8_9BACT|nr:subclass B1 metallo-beta-lactamase [Catalinimonas alkaloidigena]SDJ83936.1 metallo-beta-lactamase class B [Catalinimonas alkaloidigena]